MNLKPYSHSNLKQFLKLASGVYSTKKGDNRLLVKGEKLSSLPEELDSGYLYNLVKIDSNLNYLLYLKKVYYSEIEGDIKLSDFLSVESDVKKELESNVDLYFSSVEGSKLGY